MGFLERRRVDLNALKRLLKISQWPAASQKKGGRGCVITFFEIGYSDGSVRPDNMIDANSLKLPHAGFGPAAFNDIGPAFPVRYSETSPLEIHLIPSILSGVRNNEWRNFRTPPYEMPNAITH